MTSFQITISPHRRAAARFVGDVRRGLQKAFVQEKKKRGLNQSDIARALGVHRSVVNRELNGYKDITLGRVAELAAILGRRATIDFPETTESFGQNILADQTYGSELDPIFMTTEAVDDATCLTPASST